MTQNVLEPGQPVPDLTGTSDDGNEISIADFRGRPLVVYFYPRDATPGCTRQAQDFRDLYPQFAKLGCGILGVSRDTVASHARFRARQELPFPLIADTDGAWCEAFGVLGEKMLYGKRHIGIHRSTFLIDAAGMLQEAWRKVRVPGHAAEVLARLAAGPGGAA